MDIGLNKKSFLHVYKLVLKREISENVKLFFSPRKKLTFSYRACALLECKSFGRLPLLRNGD